MSRLLDKSSRVRKTAFVVLVVFIQYMNYVSMRFSGTLLGPMFESGLRYLRAKAQVEVRMEVLDLLGSERQLVLYIESFRKFLISTLYYCDELLFSEVESDILSVFSVYKACLMCSHEVFPHVKQCLFLIDSKAENISKAVVELFTTLLIKENEEVTDPGLLELVIGRLSRLVHHIGGVCSPKFSFLSTILSKLRNDGLFSGELISHLVKIVHNLEFLAGHEKENSVNVTLAVNSFQILVLLSMTSQDLQSNLQEFYRFLPNSKTFDIVKSHAPELQDAFVTAILRLISMENGSLQPNHFVFRKTIDLVLNGPHVVFDWLAVTQEAITCIFKSCSDPFKVMTVLINEFSINCQNFTNQQIDFMKIACTLTLKWVKLRENQEEKREDSESVTQSESEIMMEKLSKFGTFLVRHSLIAPHVSIVMKHSLSECRKSTNPSYTSALLVSLIKLLLSCSDLCSEYIDNVIEFITMTDCSYAKLSVAPYLCDLIIRYPSIVETKACVLFKFLLDHDDLLSITAIKTLSYLIMNELLKPRDYFIFVILATEFGCPGN
ncbi:hypothetical protein GEMRC1_004481 [Eukaryota sp. GEM-RC1]